MKKMLKKQAKTFDFFGETRAIRDCHLTKEQAEVAKRKGVMRILKFRYTWDLPPYVLDSAYLKGYKAVMLGSPQKTTSTWGFYRR